MANGNESIGYRMKLIRKLTLAPEARNEPSKGAYPAGKIKKFFDIFRANYSNLTIINGLSLLFVLPLIAVIGFVSAIGMENISYMLRNTDIPYLVSNFGIGLSGGAAIADTRLAILDCYRLLSAAIVVTLPIYGFGASGILYITTKLVWGEGFICKKDKFGNNVPRIVTEFFRGVKMYWKETVVYLFLFAVVIAGAANLAIMFFDGLYSGTANAGHYFALIFSIIIALGAVLMFVNLLPTVVSYKMKITDKLKNSAILSVVFIVPALFLLLFAAIPIVLMFISDIVMVILVVMFMMLGFSFYILMFVTYADNNSEKVIVPLYEAQENPSKKSKKKKKGK